MRTVQKLRNNFARPPGITKRATSRPPHRRFTLCALILKSGRSPDTFRKSSSSRRVNRGPGAATGSAP
eukprot:3135468-Pyramimonas_sp.AAC.1